MQRVRIKDDALVCRGEFGTVNPNVKYRDGSDLVAVWLGLSPQPTHDPGIAFHEWELEYV